MELIGKQNWKEKAVELGYLLGLSLWLAAIIYFFASNWPGMDKWMKITLSISLLALFYGVSFLLKFLLRRHPLLSSIFLFFGCLIFGISIALLGQIYNSHADSYMLFIIWAIPAILFSIFTKFQPFYILTFTLFHLALFFFLFPSSRFHYVPEEVVQWVFLATALINLLLFFVTERKIIHSMPLGVFSFLMYHLLLLFLTIDEFFDPFNIFVSFIYIALFVFLNYFVTKNKLPKIFVVLMGASLIAFVIIKFVEFVIYTETEYIFFFTIFLPFLLVGFVVYGLKRWMQNRKGEENSFLRKIIIATTTAIASIIAGSSLFGISLVFVNDIPYEFFAFFAIALILLAKNRKNWDRIVTYTLLFTAFVIGIPATIASNIGIDLLFGAGLVYVFSSFENRMIRYITYLSLNIVIGNSLSEINGFSTEGLISTLLFLNLLIHFISYRISKSEVQQILAHNSLFYSLLSFFILTFLFEDHKFLYYLTNGLYFLITSALVVWALKKQYRIRYKIFLLFWFAYIVYKYYDLIWSLVHKSVTFFIAGLLILLIANYFDRFAEIDKSSIITKRNLIPIVVIIVLQFAILGVQVGKSETLLAKGTLIKLELAPVDPRSLLQGDYLTLRYNVSSIPVKDAEWNQLVIVGLVEKGDGIYDYSGHYVVGKEVPEEIRQKADVWMTGRFKGYDNIEYGIENYFVPEGTGLELQEKIKFAHVKVAANGDSMLVDVTEE